MQLCGFYKYVSQAQFCRHLSNPEMPWRPSPDNIADIVIWKNVRDRHQINNGELGKDVIILKKY